MSTERIGLDGVDPLEQPVHPCMMLSGHYEDPTDPTESQDFTIHTRATGRELMTEWITARVYDTISLEEVR